MLTHENYFSNNANQQFMSYSQFKAFEQCEAAALAELQGKYSIDRECFKEGHYFEAALMDKEKEFLIANPDMVSSRGATAGELKANYKRVQGAVEAFKRQPLFMETISRCKPQVIVTGEIAGVWFKGCVDFLDDDGNGFDTKAIKDFKRVYSITDGAYVNFYFAFGYHYQAAIYRELIRQTFGKSGKQHILAVTKEEIPDVAAITFTDEILDNALEIVKEFAPRYAAIKRGEIVPEWCMECAWCKANKKLDKLEVVGEYE